MKSEQRHFVSNKWNQNLPIELDSVATLILCFFDPSSDFSETLTDLTQKFPQSQLVGCSSSGEIFDTYVYDKSLSCVFFQLEKSKIKVVASPIDSYENSFSVGQKIGQDLLAEDLKSIFILSDGLTVNGTELAYGVSQSISKAKNQVVVSGGLAGDGARFGKTFLLFAGKIESQKVVAIGFYGDAIHVGTGFFGGWDKFGPPRKITKSKGNILYEIDHKPALELYKTYLGEESKKLPSSALLFPLLIQQEGKADLVRTILSVNEEVQSMTFAGDVPENTVVQLMRANLSRLIEAAAVAGNLSMEKMITKHTGPTVAIAISCVGRRLVLGQKTDDELEVLKERLPKNSNLVGFYSYGELSSQGFSTCELHNQTMTVTVFQEGE